MIFGEKPPKIVCTDPAITIDLSAPGANSSFTEYDYCIPDYILHTSIITGKRHLLQRGTKDKHYAGFKIKIWGLNANDYETKYKLIDGKVVTFTPHADLSSNFINCIVLNVKPFYKENMNFKDAVIMTLISESYYEPKTAQYGIWWDESTSTPRCGRTGALSNYNSDGLGDSRASMNDDLFPIQNLMKRCVVLDNGIVNYYLDPDDSTKKADGTDAVLDGTDGQVKVEIPAFYYSIFKINSKVHISIGLHSFPNSVYMPKQYIGAYEASLADGKLQSISGANIQTNKTRAQFRTYAKTRGSGWNQFGNINNLALQLLYIVEYANWNSQDQISAGLSNANSIDWSNYNGYNPIVQTGLTNSLGNKSGEVAISIEHWYVGAVTSLAANKCIQTGRFASWNASYIGKTIKNTDTEATAIILSKDSHDQLTLDADIFTEIGHHFEILTVTLETQVMSYRGIENWYGHLWKFIDGINIHNSSANGSRAFICNEPDNYADDTEVDYILVGQLTESDGYIKSVIDTNKSILPATVGGNSTTYLCDYYYTYFDNNPDIGWGVCLGSGASYHGSQVGVCIGSSNNGSSYATSSVTARLCRKFIG